MKQLKLDLKGLSLEELRNYQELFITTIGRLKQGLFNAEAALGLHHSLQILSDLHIQISEHARICQEKINEVDIKTESVGV